ncbi:unnamed protein product [Darwinula stevensoni]|uniref:DUF4789 domain-containing protein n=1 Tax=Darwinula stevensoni TaxID=69355 RepID=A0A7R9FNJ4_9CRUS|nr:unnamed protein product [Darwinula stevensoni]CAG0896835.1 unnamed protein product [Darwinula stevensoni]
MLSSFSFIILPLLTSTYNVLPRTPFLGLLTTDTTEVPGDTTEIPGDTTKNLECGSFDSAFHRPSSIAFAFHRPSNACLPLLVQTVCREREWLVLNRDTKEPECEIRPCEESQLPLYSDPDICVPIDNPGKHCGLNQFLVADRFGFGHCECKNEPGYIYWPPDGNCYRVFHRGPCDPGNIFIFDSRNKTAVCRRSPCREGKIYWLSLGLCVSEENPTLCPRNMPLTLRRLPDDRFTFACETQIGKPEASIGTFTFRDCSPGSISGRMGKCKGTISLDLCPPGKEEDAFGGCRESFG